MKYIGMIFSVLFIFEGCDLFQTRDAEKPDQPRSNYQSAVTPDILLQNLVNSFNDVNLQNYLACFSDTPKSFLFIPSSGAASLYPSYSTPWDKKNESEYFTNLIARIPSDQPVTLITSNVNSSQQGDSLIYTATYALSVPFTDLSIPSLYQGDLKFYMVRDSRLIWSIYYWQDFKSSTQYPSWSELKGRLY
jgi:hypothetical protein